MKAVAVIPGVANSLRLVEAPGIEDSGNIKVCCDVSGD
jgi:hypothetical protein